MSNLNKEHLEMDAQKRIDFKRHLSIYLVVIALLWAIWLFSGGGYMWPIWPTGGWGIAVFFHYVGVFHPFQFFSVEKEVDRLKQENK